MVALLILSSIAPLSAQNSISTTRSLENSSKADSVYGGSEQGFSEASVLPDRYEVPTSAKAQGSLSEGKPVYAAQDVRTLESQISNQRSVESVVDLGVLRNPSAYRKVAVSTAGQPYEISGDGLQTGLAMISAMYRESGKTQQAADCLSVSLSVEQQTKLDLAKVLEIVDAEVRANPTCACEIVKAAIKASEADVQLVVSITETAITAAPESMRLVSQCAIASMPESISEVQALLARIEPNSGDTEVYSTKGSAKSVYAATDSKDAKGAKVASISAPAVPNPLDRPYLSPLPPPLIYPQPVSQVNPAPHCPTY
jgi:hypothetical protein